MSTLLTNLQDKLIGQKIIDFTTPMVINQCCKVVKIVYIPNNLQRSAFLHLVMGEHIFNNFKLYSTYNI